MPLCLYIYIYIFHNSSNKKVIAFLDLDLGFSMIALYFNVLVFFNYNDSLHLLDFYHVFMHIIWYKDIVIYFKYFNYCLPTSLTKVNWLFALFDIFKNDVWFPI